MPPAHSSLRRPSLLILALVCCGLALVAGCGPDTEDPAPAATAATDDGEPRRGGTLVVGTVSDMGGVNEVVNRSNRAFADIAQRMFLNLLEEQPDFADHPPTMAPALAESYEFSDDHLTLTFRLRPDAVWSDGHPVTADDVRFTWQAQTHPAVAWDGAYFKAPIRDVEVVDDKTVRFHFDRVSPYQLAEANEGVILPSHVWGELPFEEWRDNADFFLENLVVSGPYKLESWTPQQETVLVRNERYFDPELPYIDRVVFRFVPSNANQVLQLLSGDLDHVVQVPNEDIPRLQAAEDVRIDAYWNRLYTYVGWNFDRPQFQDVRVRRALAHAVDRETLVDTLWGQWARPSDSPIISDVWAHNDEIEALAYDPDRARRLLDEAGWRDTDGDGIRDKDGQPLRFSLLTNQGNQPREDAVTLIRDYLDDVGVAAEAQILEFHTMSGMVAERDYDAVLSGWGMPTNLDLRYAFHTDSIAESVNYMGYSNPRVDALIEEMERLPSLEEAGPILDELQLLIHQDQPMMLLWESQRVNGVSTRVKNVQSNLISSYFDLEEWWLAE